MWPPKLNPRILREIYRTVANDQRPAGELQTVYKSDSTEYRSQWALTASQLYKSSLQSISKTDMCITRGHIFKALGDPIMTKHTYTRIQLNSHYGWNTEQYGMCIHAGTVYATWQRSNIYWIIQTIIWTKAILALCKIDYRIAFRLYFEKAHRLLT